MNNNEMNNMTTQAIQSLNSDLMKIVTSNYNVEQLKTAKTIAELLYYMQKINKKTEVGDEIYDEMQGAHKYYDEFMKTGDRDYLQMAKDELSHARKFILMRKPLARGEEIRYIDDMLKMHDELQQKITEKMGMM